MNAPREIKGSSQWTRSDKVNTRRIVSEGIKSTFENSFGPQNTGDNRGSDSASNWRLNGVLPPPPFRPPRCKLCACDRASLCGGSERNDG